MKLWIDDFRDAPDSSWTEVRKVQPAIKFIANYSKDITHISIDHDIENRPDDETFQPVAYFIGERYAYDNMPTITIHSDNPVGAKELQAILGDYGIEAPWEPYTSERDFKAKFGLE